MHPRRVAGPDVASSQRALRTPSRTFISPRRTGCLLIGHPPARPRPRSTEPGAERTRTGNDLEASMRAVRPYEQMFAYATDGGHRRRPDRNLNNPTTSGRQAHFPRGHHPLSGVARPGKDPPTPQAPTPATPPPHPVQPSSSPRSAPRDR